jgi:hypothetical protein
VGWIRLPLVGVRFLKVKNDRKSRKIQVRIDFLPETEPQKPHEKSQNRTRELRGRPLQRTNLFLAVGSLTAPKTQRRKHEIHFFGGMSNRAITQNGTNTGGPLEGRFEVTAAAKAGDLGISD